MNIPLTPDAGQTSVCILSGPLLCKDMAPMVLLLLCFVQGIKFYDPEIVGDTPEAVEFKGLQNVVDMVAQQLGLEHGKVCYLCRALGFHVFGAW
jgi:hypothetical protein